MASRKTFKEIRKDLADSGDIALRLMEEFRVETPIGKQSRSFLRNITKSLRAWDRLTNACQFEILQDIIEKKRYKP